MLGLLLVILIFSLLPLLFAGVLNLFCMFLGVILRQEKTESFYKKF